MRNVFFNGIYRRLIILRRLILSGDRFSRNFILPNVKKVFQKRVEYGNDIKCYQKLLITGAGKVIIGDKCSFGFKYGGFFKSACVELQARTPEAVIEIGNNLATNNNVFICSSGSVKIGNDCLIGQFVTIMDFEAHGIAPDQRRNMGLIGTVEIKNNVWIGNNVTILKNTSIGNNSIVAVGAVASGHFPDNVIIGGVPARIIKTID